MMKSRKKKVAALEKAEDALDATMAKRIIVCLSATVGASVGTTEGKP